MPKKLKANDIIWNQETKVNYIQILFKGKASINMIPDVQKIKNNSEIEIIDGDVFGDEFLLFSDKY